MQDELFFNHPQSSIVNFWPKKQCDHHWWKVFHAQLVVFQSPTIIDCVVFFLCGKTPFIHNFWKIFHELQKCQRSSFICFFSRHFTFYSDRLKVLSNLKNEKIFADIECEVWTMTFKMAFLYSCHQFRKMREKSPFFKKQPRIPGLIHLFPDCCSASFNIHFSLSLNNGGHKGVDFN